MSEVPLNTIRMIAKGGGTLDTTKRMTWTHIFPDGTEKQRAGEVWCQAPSMTARKAWWVVPDERLDDEPAFVCVAVATRRIRVGVERMTPPPRNVLVWRPKGGRYVDVGEPFSEADRRSATGQATHRSASLSPSRGR